MSGNFSGQSFIPISALAEKCKCKPARIHTALAKLGHKPLAPSFKVILKPFAALVLDSMGVDKANADAWLGPEPSQTAQGDAGAVKVSFDPEHSVRPFELPPEQKRTERRFEYRHYYLITAGEKATYYMDMLNNGGREDTAKVIADCQRRLNLLRQRYESLPDLSEPEERIWMEDRQESIKKRRKLSEPDERIWREEINDLEEQIENRSNRAFEGRGRTIAFTLPMAKVKALVAFWSNFELLDGMAKLEVTLRPPLDEIQDAEVSCALAHTSGFGFSNLKAMAHHHARLLLKLAERGHKQAAVEYATFIDELVRALNLYTKAYPETFTQAARQMACWPFLSSFHTKLAHDAELLRKQVGLGKDHPLNVDRKPRWDPSDYLTQVAIELYEHIIKVRQHPEANARLAYAQEAVGLPNIKEAGAPDKWWDCARRIFMISFPLPDQEPRLNKQITAPTHRIDDDSIRAELMSRLRDRFKSLIASKSPKPPQKNKKFSPRK